MSEKANIGILHRVYDMLILAGPLGGSSYIIGRVLIPILTLGFVDVAAADPDRKENPFGIGKQNKKIILGQAIGDFLGLIIMVTLLFLLFWIL